MNKKKLLSLMTHEIDIDSQHNSTCYTCSRLEYIIKEYNLSLKLESYQAWLRSSKYFDSESSVIHTNLWCKDYNGKLAMFKAFLDQYKGPL